jgi:diamine N-acetyltransferase
MGQATRTPADEGDGLVRLRPATLDDRELIYEALARSDVTGLLLGHDSGRQTRVLSYAAFCDDYTEQYFDDSNAEGGRCFVIEVDGRACGQVNYNEIDRVRSRAELDIWMFGECFCGRGYGTEALRLLCEHLRSRLGVEGFFVKPSGGNSRALRAYEKAGFSRVDLSPEEAEREYGPPDDPDTVYMATAQIREHR